MFQWQRWNKQFWTFDVGHCHVGDLMFEQRPNLKNLSRGLNLSHRSNLVVLLKIVLNFSRFKPALNWNRFLWDFRRGLNSLNSDTGLIVFTSDLPRLVSLHLHRSYRPLLHPLQHSQVSGAGDSGQTGQLHTGKSIN